MFNNFSFALLCLLYKLSLDVVCVTHITRYFAYAGLDFSAPNRVDEFLLPCLLVLGLAYVCDGLPEGPSKMVAGLMFLMSFVPACTLVSCGGFSLTPLLLLSCGFLLLFVGCRVGNPVLRGFVVAHNYRTALFFVLGFYILSMCWLLFKYGVKLPTIALDVYNQRAEYKQSLVGNSPITAYVMTWLGNVIIPFLFIYGICCRSYFTAVLGFLALLQIFSVAGHKSHLFSLFIIMAVFIGVKFYKNCQLGYYALGMTAMICLAFVIDLFCTIPIVSSLFVRRLLVVPAQLYFYYYDFFSNNPISMLSQSIFSSFIVSPYNKPIPHIVGSFFLDSDAIYANANLFADAFANFGSLGIILFPLLLAVILNVINNVARHKNNLFVYPLLAMPCISLTNTGLLTSLVTHGLFLVLFLLILLPRQDVT